ncbi:MAG: DUF5777 family beta-barrel protein [Bacteroidia bacterium]
MIQTFIPTKLIAIVGLTVLSLNGFAQDDMLSLLDSVGTKNISERTIATFKGSKIINAQTTETVKKGTMDFNVAHSFGNVGVQSNGGAHTLYGLDNIVDVRIGFDFGITNDLTIGVGRSKQKELIDGLVKYRILNQTTNNHIPFSVALYADMAYNPQQASIIYSGVDLTSITKKSIHRFSYVSQLIIARKFNWRFSMELLPTYQFRNFVVGNINPENGSIETNSLFSLGTGLRLKLTNRFAIIADYYYIFSKYRDNNTATPFFPPLGLGFEIDTGGHIFHLAFTNCSGIIENNYIPNTTDNWLKGGYKFGFNISRVFNLGGKKHKK